MSHLHRLARASALTLVASVVLVVSGPAGAVATVFENTLPLTVPAVDTTVGPASPFPSSISVDLRGPVEDVDVTLHGVGHLNPTDLDIALRVGDLLFISGMTASDETGAVVGRGDIAAQARYIYRKMAAVLAAAGAGLEHVVQTTDYVVTTDNYRATADVRREVFRPPTRPRPASSSRASCARAR